MTTDDGDGADAAAESGTSRTPADTALLLDVMLRKLSTYLRMCGYDAADAGTRDAESDDEALALAATEGRLLLTRDRQLARRASPSVSLTARDPVDQLRELDAAGFELALADEPTRCSACNGPLERVDRTEPTPDYAPRLARRLSGAVGTAASTSGRGATGTTSPRRSTRCERQFRAGSRERP